MRSPSSRRTSPGGAGAAALPDGDRLRNPPVDKLVDFVASRSGNGSLLSQARISGVRGSRGEMGRCPRGRNIPFFTACALCIWLESVDCLLLLAPRARSRVPAAGGLLWNRQCCFTGQVRSPASRRACRAIASAAAPPQCGRRPSGLAVRLDRPVHARLGLRQIIRAHHRLELDTGAKR
jgi:hypothetical protein